jgi:hypothetical protein
VGACVVRICGFERSFFALVVVVGISSLFALLQFMGFGAAYDARNFLGSFQPVDPEGRKVFRDGGGEGALPPVLLGTQLCLCSPRYSVSMHKHERHVTAGFAFS